MNANQHSRVIRTLLALAATLAVLLWTGCSKETHALENAAGKFSDTLNSLKSATFDNRAALSDTLGKAADAFSAKASEWGSKISTLPEDARASAQSALNELNTAIANFKGKLSGASGATSSTWDDVKNGLLSAYKDAQDAYAKVQAHFSPAQPKS